MVIGTKWLPGSITTLRQRSKWLIFLYSFFHRQYCHHWRARRGLRRILRLSAEAAQDCYGQEDDLSAGNGYGGGLKTDGESWRGCDDGNGSWGCNVRLLCLCTFTSGGSIPNARSPRSSLSDQTENMAIFAKKIRSWVVVGL